MESGHHIWNSESQEPSYDKFIETVARIIAKCKLDYLECKRSDGAKGVKEPVHDYTRVHPKFPDLPPGARTATRCICIAIL
jgi:hypothetical protein